MRRWIASLALAFTVVCAGCSTATGPDDNNHQTQWEDDVARSGPAEEPVLEPVTEPQMTFYGRYALTTYLDLAGSGVFGETVSGTLVALSEFHENPAGTILDLLALYDTPYFSVVWNVLPGIFKDYIEGWLNDYVFDAIFEGVPVIDQVVQIIDDIASISRNVELQTELTLWPPDADGRMAAHHEMRGIGFTLWESYVGVDLPPEFTGLVAADPIATLEIRESPNPVMPEGLLRIEDHTFGLPFGDMLLNAINQLVFEPNGFADLRDWLGQSIDCTGLGEWLADLCVGGTCAGDYVSVEELANMCGEALDLIAYGVEAPIRALNIDLLEMKAGHCKMYDKGYSDYSGDYRIDALTDGAWTASIGLLGFTFNVESSFVGQRITQ